MTGNLFIVFGTDLLALAAFLGCWDWAQDRPLDIYRIVARRLREPVETCGERLVGKSPLLAAPYTPAKDIARRFAPKPSARKAPDVRLAQQRQGVAQ